MSKEGFNLIFQRANSEPLYCFRLVLLRVFCCGILILLSGWNMVMCGPHTLVLCCKPTLHPCPNLVCNTRVFCCGCLGHTVDPKIPLISPCFHTSHFHMSGFTRTKVWNVSLVICNGVCVYSSERGNWSSTHDPFRIWIVTKTWFLRKTQCDIVSQTDRRTDVTRQDVPRDWTRGGGTLGPCRRWYMVLRVNIMTLQKLQSF